MKVLSILNYKGGCGKTATAINLAYELSKKYKTLVIDLDPQADLSSKFTNNFEDMTGISEVLKSEALLENAIYNSGINDNLFYVPSKIELNDTSELIGARAQVVLLQKVLERVKDKFDLVIIDNNPNCPPLFRNNIYVADYVLIPINIYNNTIKGIDYTIKQINNTVYDSPIPLKVDIRIMFTMVTQSAGKETNNAKEVIKSVREFYGPRVLNSSIRMQSKPSQDQSFIRGYFATDDPETGFGKDYIELSKEIEDLLFEKGEQTNG